MDAYSAGTVTVEEAGTGRYVIIPVGRIYFAECAEREKESGKDRGVPYGECRRLLRDRLKAAADQAEAPDDPVISEDEYIPELDDESSTTEEGTAPFRSFPATGESRHEFLLRIGLGWNPENSVIEFVFPDEKSRDREAEKVKSALARLGDM